MRLRIVHILKLTRQKNFCGCGQFVARVVGALHAQRFLGEANLSAKTLNHENALAAHAFGHDGDELQTQVRAHHCHGDAG